MKLLLFSFSLLVLLLMNEYFKHVNVDFEIFILFLLLMLSFSFLMGSNDFIFFYICLEVQSLIVYIFASSLKGSSLSAEGGIKYFSLGSLSSAVFLLGASIFYFLFGSTNFSDMSLILFSFSLYGELEQGALFLAVVLVLVAFFFKVAAVPFHNWAPDVYQAAPYYVSVIFLTLPKLVMLTLLFRFLFQVLGAVPYVWQMPVLISGLLSVLVGSFSSLRQWKVRSLLAFSGMTNVGFLLLALLPGDTLMTKVAFFFYLFIYVFLNLNLFFLLFSMGKGSKGVPIDNLSDFSALANSFPLLSLQLSLVLFSFAGLPPLAGFFSKFLLFFSLFTSGFYLLVFILLIFSIVSSIYYTYLVKLMFFNKGGFFISSPSSTYLFMVATILTFVNTFFVFFFHTVFLFFLTVFI